VALGRQLVRRGWAAVTDDAYATLSLTPAGLELLKQRTPVLLVRERQVSAGRGGGRGRAEAGGPGGVRAGDIPCDEGLFQELRQLRKLLADELGVPPYVIFSDVTLRHVARVYPQREQEFLTVPGVGEKKLKDFGVRFMGLVGEWLAAHERQDFGALRAAPPAAPRPAAAPKPKGGAAAGVGATAVESLKLWRGGRTIEQIAALRDLNSSTIETHLAAAIEAGAELDPRAFYSEEEEARISEAFAGCEGEALSPVFSALGGLVSYGKIRIFRAFQKREEEG